MSKFRCVTINVRGVDLGWFEWREASMIRELSRLKPDVLCLQETAIRQSAPFYNQARVIAQALGLKSSAFANYGNPAQVSASIQYGIAIVSRWPLLEVRVRKLPSGHGGPADTRVALFAEIDAPDGPLGVVTTHLSWRPEEAEIRSMQLGLMMRELAGDAFAASTARIVLAGDLNATPDEPAIRALSDYFTDAYAVAHPGEPGHTWSSRNPLTLGAHLGDRRLDYIFCGKTAEVRKSQVILDQPAPVFISDHFGVFAELEWRENAG